MKTIKIECNKITSIDSLYDELKIVLGLSEFFGNNLDALWDSINGEIELPVKIIWVNFDMLKNNLDSKFVEKFMELIDEAKDELGELFDFVYN